MNKNTPLLIGAIFGTLYTIFIVIVVVAIFASGAWEEGMEGVIGTSVLVAIIVPHAVAALVALVFNWIAWAGNKRSMAIVSGVIYIIALVLGILTLVIYSAALLIPLILSFVGATQLKKTG